MPLLARNPGASDKWKLLFQWRLTLSMARTILALPAWTVMSEIAPGGVESWSTPVETSDETGVSLTMVVVDTRALFTSRRYQILLTCWCCCYQLMIRMIRRDLRLLDHDLEETQRCRVSWRRRRFSCSTTLALYCPVSHSIPLNSGGVRDADSNQLQFDPQNWRTTWRKAVEAV